MNTLEHTQSISPTAVICENMEYFGGAPAKGEPDPRAVWDREEAFAGLDNVLDILIDEVAPDGTQFADERESLLWGFVNTLHMQSVRLDRTVDRLSPELKNLQRAQDGTEINAWELERIIERARNLGDRRDAFEQLRDAAAERYRADTGNTWRPRNGSHTSRTSKLTSAAIDARDFLRARENSKTQAHLPEGTLVAVAGSKPVDDANVICSALDNVRGKYPDMVRAWRRTRCGEDRGALGRVQGRAPGRLQAGLDRARTGRAVQKKRSAAQSAAEGRHRVPRLGNLREPPRQGRAVGHSGTPRRCLAARLAPGPHRRRAVRPDFLPPADHLAPRARCGVKPASSEPRGDRERTTPASPPDHEEKPMSRITFKRVGPEQSDIYDDGDYVGEVYSQPDILNPGARYFVIHLIEDPRGWVPHAALVAVRLGGDERYGDPNGRPLPVGGPLHDRPSHPPRLHTPAANQELVGHPAHRRGGRDAAGSLRQVAAPEAKLPARQPPARLPAAAPVAGHRVQPRKVAQVVAR